jgi:putative ABC transport system permease protein
LQGSAKEFLSADIAIEARRKLTDNEVLKFKSVLPKDTLAQKQWEFYSMASTAGLSEQQTGISRLAQIKSIDDQYPYYGQIVLASGLKVNSQNASKDLDIFKEKKAWVHADILSLFDTKIGAEIKIGGDVFTIADVIIEDSTQSFRFATLAPKIYVARKWMESSSLLSFGSTMSEAWLIKMPEASSDSFIKEIKDKITDSLTDPTINVQTYVEAGGESSRLIGYLSDYLGIVSIVALFLAWIGSAYLFRSFIYSQQKNIAIYVVQGLQRSQAQNMYIATLCMLGFLASLLSISMAWIIFPILEKLLIEFTPAKIQLSLTLPTVVVALAMGLTSALFVCYPILLPLKRLNISHLFREQSQFQYSFNIKDGLFYIPTFFILLGLAIWQSNSFKVGSYFLLSLLACTILLIAMALVFIEIFRALLKSKFWVVRHGALLLVRRPLTTVGAIFSLGLASMLLNLMPQLKSTLKVEIQNPARSSLPSLFVFDVQDEQLSGLENIVKGYGKSFSSLSPMVRARISSVNDVVFERVQSNSEFKTREEETEIRFRNRAVNLSFRNQLSASETLIEGTMWSGPFVESAENKLPMISVEKRFAERLKIKIKDRIKFDIQGVQIEGQVANFRTVQWNSFQPNFFLLLQPGVLDDAPKTWLGSISDLSAEQVLELQSLITKNFNNISVVDVRRVIEQTWALTEKMSWALEFMAWLCVFAGFMVLFSIFSHQAQARRQEINLFKILGATPTDLYKLVIIESFGTAIVACFFGVIFSIAFAAVLSYVIFDSGFAMTFWPPVLTTIGIVFGSLVLSIFTSRRVINDKPAELLSETKK